MISRLKRIFCHFFCHGKCSYRNSISNCFCHRHDVRFYTISLPCKHRTCTSHTTLNLITNQKNSFFITNLAESFHKFISSRSDSAFPLKSFQNNCACLITYQCFYTVKVIVFCKFHARYQWLKWRSIMLCSGNRQCSHTSSMERIFHSNELITSGTFFVSIFSGSF